MQQRQNNISDFLSKYTYIIIALTLVIGIGVGYFSATFRQSKIDATKSPVKVVQFLISDGENTRNWNNVTLNEGDSIAKILSRIAEVEGLQIAWDGEDKDRTLASLMDKATLNGDWTYYVNNSTPLPTIGRFFPKNADVLSIIYTSKKTLSN